MRFLPFRVFPARHGGRAFRLSAIASATADGLILFVLAVACAGGSLLAADFNPGILKFQFAPEGRKEFPGFKLVGPGSVYSSQSGYGWTIAPNYFTTFRRFESFPDLLACNLAAPSAPLTDRAAGYSGAFEFRLDLPPGQYQVAVMSGNYGYLPSQIETFAYDNERQTYALPAPERIMANGQKAWERQFTNQSLADEFYHDINTVLRRGMNLWDRVVSWRFPIRSFPVAVGQEGLKLRFENMPVNAIMVWPADREAEGRAFLEELTTQRRAFYPAKDITPSPANAMPDLPAGAEASGYFLFTPHWSERIYPTTIPRAEWLKREVRVAAAPGQFESFTVAAYPLRDLKRCAMTVSDLRGPNGARLPSSAVDVKVMRYLELQSGEGPNYQTVAYLPLKWDRLPVDAAMPRVWWFTVKPPRGTRPGQYSGWVTFESANAPSARIALKVEVYPFELRPLKDHYEALYHDYWQFPGGGQDRHVQWQRDAGFNVITTRGTISGLTYRNGLMSRPDFSDWAGELAVYRRNGFPMQLVVSQSALAAAYKATGEYHTEPGFEAAHQVKDHFSPEFDDCYKRLAAAIQTEFKRRRWPNIIFYESGEAACEGPRGVRTETHLMKLLREAGVKNTASVSGEATPLSLRYSAPRMYLTILSEVNPENLRRVREAGSLAGIYGPGQTRFERGFWFWRTRAEICSEEGGVALYGNPYDPFDGSRNADWGDVYPTPIGPAISLRTAGKRAGINDARYLFQLEEMSTEANRRGSIRSLDASAHAARLLLEIMRNIRVDISRYETVEEEIPGPALDRLREIVASEIEKVGPALSR